MWCADTPSMASGRTPAPDGSMGVGWGLHPPAPWAEYLLGAGSGATGWAGGPAGTWPPWLARNIAPPRQTQSAACVHSCRGGEGHPGWLDTDGPLLGPGAGSGPGRKPACRTLGGLEPSSSGRLGALSLPSEQRHTSPPCQLGPRMCSPTRETGIQDALPCAAETNRRQHPTPTLSGTAGVVGGQTLCSGRG